MTKHIHHSLTGLRAAFLGTAFLFLASPIMAALIQNPFFSVTSPPDQFQTSAASIVVAGQFAKPVDRVEINGASAVIEKNSAFHLSVILKKGERSQFNIVAFQGKRRLKSELLTVVSKAAPASDNETAPANTADVMVASGGGKPDIQLSSPANQWITDQNFVLIEGTVTDAVELRINNHRVPIFQGGRFVSKEPIAQANVPTTFLIIAKNKAGIETAQRRTVTSHGSSNNALAPTPVVPVIAIPKAVEKPVLAAEKSPVVKPSAPAPRKSAFATVPSSKVSVVKTETRPLSPPSRPEATPAPAPVQAEGPVAVVPPRVEAPASDREPTLTLSSPDPNFFARVPRVLVKGQTKYAHSLTINGQPIKLSRSGRFYQVITLPEKDRYFTIKIQAESRRGKSIVATRKAYYQASEMTFSAPSVATKLTPPIANLTPSAPPAPTPPPTPQNSPNSSSVTWVYPKNGTRTSASLIAVYGNIDAGSTLEINDQSVPVGSDGKFKTEIPVTIKPVENNIHLQATLPTGKIVDIYRTVVYDANSAGFQREIMVPKLTVFEPTPFGMTSKDSVFVSGKVENTTVLMINERRVVPKPDGLFSEKFALSAFGKVLFNLMAIGADGQTTTKSIQITHKLESMQPLIKAVASQSSLQSQLNRRVSLELTDSPIKEVLKILAKKGDLNIVADKSLTGTVTISLNDLSIINAINLILNSQGLSYQIIDNTILVAPADALKSATTLDTKVIYLKNIPSGRVESIIKDRLAQTESIQTLAEDNVVIITADPKKLQQLADLVARLDSVKTAQVVIEAQIIETSTSALEGLGVAWPTSVGSDFSLSKTDGTTTIKAATSVSAIVNMLESQGKAKILARPRIKAIDGQSANIFIGDKVPYTEITEDSTGKISETVKFVDSGITLKILPNINTQDQEVRIKIEPEVSFIHGWRGKNSDVPWVKTRKVDTTVSVKNNETVVIGGLFNSSDSADQSKVPILGDIPFIGAFFTNNKTDQNLSQLVITITPRIIQSGESDYFPAQMK